jgi:ceramide glucosyltransferase
LIHPFAFALLAVLLSGGAAWAWLLAALALLARQALKVLSDRSLGQPLGGLWLLPFWDIVSFSIFLASFLSTRVNWRGFSFKVDGNGLLSPVRTNDGSADSSGRLRDFEAESPETAKYPNAVDEAI